MVLVAVGSPPGRHEGRIVREVLPKQARHCTSAGGRGGASPWPTSGSSMIKKKCVSEKTAKSASGTTYWYPSTLLGGYSVIAFCDRRAIVNKSTRSAARQTQIDMRACGACAVPAMMAASREQRVSVRGIEK